MNKIVWLFGMALVLAGCSDAPETHRIVDPLDKTGTWRLATMTADGVTTDRPQGAMGTVQFAGGQVSGTGTCNHYSSSYKIVDGKLEFVDGFLSTAMGCDDLDFESRFLGLLSACSVIELGAETLTLSDGTAKNRLSFLPEVVFRLPLVGTSWSCTGLQTTSSDTVELTMTGDRLSLRVDADGAVSGSIDCNTFNGKAKISDGTIEVGALEVTEEGCNPAPLGQDVDVLKWLTAADSYEIRDKQLQLIDSESGNRLIFEGAPASQP